jgi:glycosyltransferase involved in cell wall biosynthesis
MGILFGHPGGSAFSHNAALAHWERGRLAAFCVPWMPTPMQLRLLAMVPGMDHYRARLARRCFEPLLAAPRIEGKTQEIVRLLRRLVQRSVDSTALAYQANDWLMQVMRRHAGDANVAAVHAYEDCSLLSFEEAQRLGKPRIYDMPIGYYPAWADTQRRLLSEYRDWVAPAEASGCAHVRPEQKKLEMELADIVLAPSPFVADTIRRFVDKRVFIAPYGIDTQRWRPGPNDANADRPLRVLFVGHVSIRKGIPVLLEAWRRAALGDGARLELVGTWTLSEASKSRLPPGVDWLGHRTPNELLNHYRRADLFVFPSFFEGFSLAIGEALGSGAPVLVTEASGAAGVVDESCGSVVPAGNVDALVEQLRYFASHRDRLASLRAGARAKAESLTWANYRRCVAEAVDTLGL